MQRRVKIVTRNALGDSISTSDACCQRINVSCNRSFSVRGASQHAVGNAEQERSVLTERFQAIVPGRFGRRGSRVWKAYLSTGLKSDITLRKMAVRTAVHTTLDSKLAATLQDSPEFPNQTIVATERHTLPLTRPDSRTFCDTLILWTNDPLARESTRPTQSRYQEEQRMLRALT